MKKNMNNGERALLAYAIILVCTCILVIFLTSPNNLKLFKANNKVKVKKVVNKIEEEKLQELKGKSISIYKKTSKEMKDNVEYGEKSDFENIGSKEEVTFEATFKCATYSCELKYVDSKYALVNEYDSSYNKVIQVIDYHKNKLLKTVKYKGYNVKADFIDKNIIRIYNESGYLKVYNIDNNDSYESNNSYMNNLTSAIDSKYILVSDSNKADENGNIGATKLIEIKTGKQMATIKEPVSAFFVPDHKVYILATYKDGRERKGILYDTKGKKVLSGFRYIETTFDKKGMEYVKDSVLYIADSNLKVKKSIKLKGVYQKGVPSINYLKTHYEYANRQIFLMKENNKLNMYEYDRKKQKVSFVNTLLDKYDEKVNEIGFSKYYITPNLINIDEGEYMATSITSDDFDITNDGSFNYQYTEEDVKYVKENKDTLKSGYFYYYNLKTKKIYRFPYILEVD